MAEEDVPSRYKGIAKFGKPKDTPSVAAPTVPAAAPVESPAKSPDAHVRVVEHRRRLPQRKPSGATASTSSEAPSAGTIKAAASGTSAPSSMGSATRPNLPHLASAAKPVAKPAAEETRPRRVMPEKAPARSEGSRAYSVGKAAKPPSERGGFMGFLGKIGRAITGKKSREKTTRAMSARS